VSSLNSNVSVDLQINLYDVSLGTKVHETARREKASFSVQEIYEGLRWILFSNR
jgi:hypothetical protein